MFRRSLGVRGCPNTITSPESSGTMFMIMRMDVVLPAPLGPSSPKMLPGGTAIETSSTATKSPYVLRTLRSSRMGVMWFVLFRRGRVPGIGLPRAPVRKGST